MPVISKIPRLRTPGVFNNFSWPADLPEFARFNLIYGWNGSGKTTISRMFRALELGTPPGDSEVTFTIDGRETSNDDFTDAGMPVRVFNRDFIDASVFPLGEGDVPPIFVLGRESAEKQRAIDQLKTQKVAEQEKLNRARDNQQKAANDLDRFNIDHAKFIKESLRSSGTTIYNNYNKGNFVNRAREMVTAGDNQTYILDESSRDKLTKIHRASPKSKLPEIRYSLPDLNWHDAEVTKLLSKTVVSQVIQNLKDDTELSGWSQAGLGIHQKRKTNQCLFCGQPLPKGRLAALEAHFSTAYTDLLHQLDEQATAIRGRIEAANKMELPSSSSVLEDLVADLDQAVQLFNEQRKSAIEALKGMLKAVTEKRNRMFESFDHGVSVPPLDATAADKLHAVIQKHNQACDDFQSRTEKARQQLEAHYVATDLQDFATFESNLAAFTLEADTANKNIKKFQDDIDTLETEIKEHRQPAEEINRELNSYLGHNELTFAVKDTGYKITRNGSPARALSEGETTAVALLYFLKSLRDRNFDLGQGIVVLDDPVSSMDANALFLAFSYIRERTQDAGQFFILTHNFTLFNQIKNWFHSLPKQNSTRIERRPARFYSLSCSHDGCQRCSCICQMDSALEEYESEYHFLFKSVYLAAISTDPLTLENSYIFPNMARRILEAFLAFRQPRSDNLWEKMKRTGFDEARRIRIYRFLNTHSHGDPIDDPGHDLSLLAEAKTVLKDFFDFIKDQDEEHYNAMVELVS